MDPRHPRDDGARPQEGDDKASYTSRVGDGIGGDATAAAVEQGNTMNIEQLKQLEPDELCRRG